jgi:hypothetical protein
MAVRCPNCGSEAVREEAARRGGGGSLAYLFLGVITGVLFFVLVLVVFFVIGYLNRFVFPFIEYSPFILVVLIATIITWMPANRIGRSWMGGAAVAPGAPPGGADSGVAVQRRCEVCQHTWMKASAAPAA